MYIQMVARTFGYSDRPIRSLTRIYACKKIHFGCTYM